MPPDTDEETKTIARRTLAYLRSLDRKLDLVMEVSQRNGERLARIERDLGEARRDLGEIRRDIGALKGDIALPENKVIGAQAEILGILRRLDPGSDRVQAQAWRPDLNRPT